MKRGKRSGRDSSPLERLRTDRSGVAVPRPFSVRTSSIQGRGGFAWKWIPAGTRIIEYKGERISPDEADERYDDESMKRHHTFLFAVDDDTVIDAGVRGNAARFINHSCDPNCEAVDYNGRIFVEALRDIAPGEELNYDYAYELDEPDTPWLRRQYPCHCGAAKCRGTILAVNDGMGTGNRGTGNRATGARHKASGTRTKADVGSTGAGMRKKDGTRKRKRKTKRNR